MREPVNRIDHVLVNVGTSLDAASENWRRLGFHLTDRGHHSIGSSNHLAIFETDYLELLGYEAQNAHLDSGQWGNEPGLAGLIFKTADAAALAQSLHDRDIATQTAAPQALSRPVDLPDGSQPVARFRTLHLDPASTPEGRIFFCEHQTPELVWRAQWQDHPNGATGIAGVVLATDDPQAAAALTLRLYPGLDAKVIEGGLRIELDGATIEWLLPAAATARYGDALPQWTQGGVKRVALILRTTSLANAEAVLRAAGISFTRTADGALVVAAADASGVALVFSA